VRKSVITTATPEVSHEDDESWLDLERLARVEVSSEDESHPVEAALVRGSGSGWRASASGEQTLRLLFGEPQRLRRIGLLFLEEERARTQEFVLRWSPDGGQTFRDVVRQQYNFSPVGATLEAEEYEVALEGVTALELVITPDVSGGLARASLERLRLA
jgi:F5/8 type C domain